VVLTINDAAVDRRTIGMHVEDRQKNSDTARFVFQHFVFVQFHNVHHGAIRSSDDYFRIYRRCAVGITEKRDSAQKEQHKKPECPCREQSENDREHGKKSQNPACFPESLKAHKGAYFGSPKTAGQDARMDGRRFLVRTTI
jgi:hypothetical protein